MHIEAETGRGAGRNEAEAESHGMRGAGDQPGQVVDVGRAVGRSGQLYEGHDGVVGGVPKEAGGGAAHAEPPRDGAEVANLAGNVGPHSALFH